MFTNFLNLIVAAAGTKNPPPSGWQAILSGPFIPLMGVFVLFIWWNSKQQKKRIEERNKILNALKAGDEIILTSGIYATISKIREDNLLLVKLNDKTEVKIARYAISGTVANNNENKV